MYARRAGAALAAIGIAASLWAAAPEEKKPEAPKPSPETEKLSYFAAPWTSEGNMRPGPNGAGGPTQGREMCRWMPGKFFLGCMMESKDPSGVMTQVQGMLGWDAEKKVYRMWTFDNSGRYEVATGTVKDDTWTWLGESHVSDKTVQTRLVFSDTKPETYAVSYETSPDGKSWTLVWSGKYTKLAPRAGLTPGARPSMVLTPAPTRTPAPK
jgi:hypothetical protein